MSITTTGAGQPTDTAAAAGFSYDAVNFNGSTRLNRGAGLTGLADGPQGTFSLFVKFAAAGDSVSQRIFQNNGGADGLRRNSSNIFQCAWNGPSGGTPTLTFQTVSTIDSSRGWLHLCGNYDGNFGAGSKITQLFVNDASDNTVTADFGAAGSFDYTLTDWIIGATSIGSSFFQGDMAEFWWNDSLIDMSNVTNRRLFVTAGLKPVDLGTDGSVPLGGTKPKIYQHVAAGAAASGFATNLGSGGGWTVTGTLALASSKP